MENCCVPGAAAGSEENTDVAQQADEPLWAHRALPQDCIGGQGVALPFTNGGPLGKLINLWASFFSSYKLRVIETSN